MFEKSLTKILPKIFEIEIAKQTEVGMMGASNKKLQQARGTSKMITVYAIHPEPSGFGAYHKVDNSPIHYPDLETLDDYIEPMQQEDPEDRLIKDGEEIEAADGHVYYQNDGVVIGCT